MKAELRNILLRKRYLELECLGIPVQLYYKAIKLIERHVYVVVKESHIYIFKKHDFGLHSESESKTSKYYDGDKIVALLMDVMGIDKLLAFNIYSEWIREKVIYVKMTEETNKYWDFLCLPASYIDFGDKDNEYNF